MSLGISAAGAALIGGALVAGGTVYAANKSSNAAKSAANAQSAATNTALGEQQREFDTNQANYAPYLAAGKDALTQLQAGINTPVTAADVMSDPGYQFGLDQGQTALDRKIAAMGGRVSGAALKATDQYATNYATTGYNAAYQRNQDRLNRLAALANITQTATSNSAQSGQASTNAISNLVTNQGDASAASALTQGNIWGSAGNQLTALAGQYAKNYWPTSTGYTAGGSATSNLPDNIDAGGGWNPSDVRLKRGLRAVGVSPRGFTVYDWTWRADGSPGRGVVAQEVGARDPSAVRVGANGFLQVDYSRV